MAFAALRLLRSQGKTNKGSFLWLIYPWVLFSIFGGMGPPPETAAGWALQATEQIFRYTFLIAGGILTTIGFFRLSKLLANTNGRNQAKWSVILMYIALPLFILNMAYWGYFLTHVFVTYSAQNFPSKPHWISTLGDVFSIIRMVEVALFYLATALLAAAFKLTGQLSNKTAVIYIVFSILGALLNLIPGTVTGPLAIASYLSYIPAFTMLMPYLIAVNILAKPRS